MALLSFVVMLGLAGCSSQGQVISLQNGELAGLSADDVVRVMQRAGFSDDQILDLGAHIRNALAETGAAQVQVGEKVEAIFMVNRKLVMIASRKTGNHIYNVDTGSFQ
jgi:hypothetical protein